MSSALHLDANLVFDYLLPHLLASLSLRSQVAKLRQVAGGTEWRDAVRHTGVHTLQQCHNPLHLITINACFGNSNVVANMYCCDYQCASCPVRLCSVCFTRHKCIGCQASFCAGCAPKELRRVRCPKKHGYS